MNMSIRTVLHSNDDSLILRIVPLSVPGNTRLLLHIVTRKETSAPTAHDLSRVEKLTNVGQIAAGIAHERNTPVGSIILSAGNIIESSKTNEIAEEATRIKKRAEHCSTVVRELLGYVREADTEMAVNELLSIISTVTGLMTSELQKRDIALSINSAVDKLTVRCNENQIEQVLFNLLNNAIHAINRDGSIEIGVQIDSMLQRVHLVVKDDGTGISPENIDRVFDPFFTTKPGTQGTGIGLALCKKIILEHGGDIAVESTEGAGTTFNLWLPLRND
jgi:signal transduction histidine kinase